MRNDFLYEMGFPGLTGRLKRLNDLFVNQTKQFYKEYDIDIEPNWHMIFLLLEKNEKLSIQEIADNLQISHPGVIKLTKKMKRNGYLDSEHDSEDNRKHLLKLSGKAKQKLPELHRYWRAGNQAIAELLNNNKQLLEALRTVEQNMEVSDFKERMTRIYQEE
jgi:DNA-binding MarR family transcriptional regulator|nr:MarR family transcriptional regulator [uncultured Allomuricauda sp.]